MSMTQIQLDNKAEIQIKRLAVNPNYIIKAGFYEENVSFSSFRGTPKFYLGEQKPVTINAFVGYGSLPDGENFTEVIENAYIEVDTPNHISIDEVICNETVPNCFINNKISYENIGNIKTRLTISGQEMGIDSIKFTIKSEITGDTVLKEFNLPIIVGKSSSNIQQLIDAADNETLEIEPGIYLGGLNLNNKKTILKSKNGADQTILIGSDQSFEYTRMDYGSMISGFTLTDQSIIIGGIGAALQQNKFSNLGYHLNGIHVSIEGSSQGSVVFEQNILDVTKPRLFWNKWLLRILCRLF